MSRTHRILWGEGVFLRPQHFQQQELFQEARINRCLGFSHAHPWGVEAVKVDREALLGGSLRLDRLELVFQDGSFFEAPDKEPLPASRALNDIPGLGNEALIHACLPVLNAFGGNCAGLGESAGRPVRFQMERVQVADLFTDALESEVTVLRSQVRLMLELENRDGHLSVPIARLGRDSAGAWAVDDSFVPPVAAIRGAPPVLALLKRLLDILRVKSQALAAAHRERARSVMEYGTSDIASFWLLHTVNSSYPLLSHLLAHPQAHPEEAYQALARLAGELLTFSSSQTLAEIPAYRHQELTSTFQQLDTLLRSLLDTVISSRYTVIPLLDSRPSFHLGHLDSDRLAEGHDFYLSVSGELPAAALLEAVPLKFKVGSPDDVEKILNSALPGVGLHPVSRTPAAVPVRVGNHYFALDPNGPIFERMLKSRCICIYVPHSLPPLKLELIAVLR
jgi:type VI secretion system protein ImpJ